MADAVDLGFTDEEIHQQAMGNASTLPYVMAAFARACGRTPDDAADLVGRLFAPSWDELKGAGALAVARTMALNMVACGAEVQGLTGDEQSAELRFTGVLTEDDAAFFGVSRDDADRFTGVFGPIAAHLGMEATWHREGEQIVITVRQLDR